MKNPEIQSSSWYIVHVKYIAEEKDKTQSYLFVNLGWTEWRRENINVYNWQIPNGYKLEIFREIIREVLNHQGSSLETERWAFIEITTGMGSVEQNLHIRYLKANIS